MKGQIANFSAQHGQGIIRGEDGQNYVFSTQAWQQPNAPMAGMMVEFLVDAQGHATSIQPTMSTMQTQANPVTMNPYQAPQQMGGQVMRQGNEINPVWAVEEDYGFFDWVKKCLQNYANFNGRARRKEYWYFYLFFIMIYILLAVVDGMLGTDGILVGIGMLAFMIPNLATSARRLHDINKSGWWVLISIIPFVGILLLVWLATDTKPEPNQWGLPARQV
ncbi:MULTISPECIES: DUF805 domain-containing protein [unclassified Moraxella]|uniref:DUF805 domain-containing protein n=1 Tax=unclassified Moraxella TaxID=2685852 RepID=UPI003AF438E4